MSKISLKKVNKKTDLNNNISKTKKKSKYTFALVHFGNKPKYLELELYFLINLRKYTSYDITYLYSINDTPEIYPKIISNFVTNIVPYDDKGFSYEIDEFKSQYQHFNTLRTCNFIYAYLLTNYQKVCIIESDMTIVGNIDNIFELNVPAILHYTSGKEVEDNYKYSKLSKSEIIKTCTDFKKQMSVNGGILLFKPSKAKFEQYKKNIKVIIDNNCFYPNEKLYVYTNSNLLYNVPMKYNFSHYHFKKYNFVKNILIYHFNDSEYKPLNIIKDGWMNKLNNDDKKRIVKIFYDNYYLPNHKNINELMKIIE